MPNIVLNSLSPNPVIHGSTLTCNGSNMASTNWVNFVPATGAATVVQCFEGTAIQCKVTVPPSLATGAYSIHLTTGMGGGDTSNSMPVSVAKPGGP